MFGNADPQRGDQQIKDEGVERLLRAHEHQTPVDEFGVRRKVGEMIKILRGEPARRRHRPSH